LICTKDDEKEDNEEGDEDDDDTIHAACLVGFVIEKERVYLS
jgi:hypothetical protein